MTDENDQLTIIFQPDGRKVHVSKGISVLEAAIQGGVGIEGPCGGQGTCGMCKVKVLTDDDRALKAPNENERGSLSKEELDEGMRLACQVVLDSEATIEVSKDSRLYKHLILMTGLEAATAPVPNVTVNTLVKDDKNFALISIGERVVAKRPGDQLNIYGVAVDLGTTTVVCHLVDLKSGSTIASTVALNPQMARGDDVISRIRFASDTQGASWLTQKAREVVNSLILEACDDANIGTNDIFEMTFAGNTSMHHLFFGLNVGGLGEAPYIPATTGSLTVLAKDVGIRINKVGQIYSLPVLAGFLGADAAAVAVTAALDCFEGTRLAIDIGTNGEILLCTKGKIYGCSSPAGPAFEGAQIGCGMRASTGAISYLQIKYNKVIYSVIGGARPRGITGSGLVDAAASLLDAGLLEPSGRFVKDKKGGLLRKGPDGTEFLVAASGETQNGKDIVITQKDIRQLQLAKGAIAAGIAILLDEAKLAPVDIDDIYVAGAFGNYIDRKSAMTIGLLPQMDPRKIISIGNAAAIGAKRALVSLRERARAETIAKRINYIELSGRKDFQDVFMGHISF